MVVQHILKAVWKIFSIKEKDRRVFKLKIHISQCLLIVVKEEE